LDLQHRFSARNNFIKTTAQILGGAFFLFGLYFTWANLVATQEKNITELYTKAVEQLGTDKLEVRLGAIYALERIARDSQKDHWPIMEVLIAYVRENAPWPTEELAVARKKRPWAKPRDKKPSPSEKEETAGKGEAAIKPDPDIQAVLTVLGRSAIPFARKEEKRRLDLRATNLEGADLEEVNLEGAIFYYANLRETNLVRTNLQGARFFGATLQGANFGRANLQEARLSRANSQGAHLYLPNLQGADLYQANLKWADLMEANLQRAYLNGANLEGSLLNKANLQEADLYQANLQGARLSDAKNLTEDQVKEALVDQTTELPEHLQHLLPKMP
jgi:uncharacterized protein YjbI with pentapeptide repeats